MNQFTESTAAINAELAGVIRRIDEKQVDALIAAIQAAARIALYGVGQEGLMMKALAMRLYHLGYAASVVGDMTTPHGELLVLEILKQTGKTIDEARDRHTNLE
ncbi:MAG TPA: hypothetical protein VE242_03285 [Chthoniobacterales bacterium]|nr:hypothetical protein [Chthoniobacterales bacterium]